MIKNTQGRKMVKGRKFELVDLNKMNFTCSCGKKYIGNRRTVLKLVEFHNVKDHKNSKTYYFPSASACDPKSNNKIINNKLNTKTFKKLENKNVK
jgi:hypothetical protein